MNIFSTIMFQEKKKIEKSKEKELMVESEEMAKLSQTHGK